MFVGFAALEPVFWDLDNFFWNITWYRLCGWYADLTKKCWWIFNVNTAYEKMDPCNPAFFSSCYTNLIIIIILLDVWSSPSSAKGGFTKTPKLLHAWWKQRRCQCPIHLRLSRPRKQQIPTKRWINGPTFYQILPPRIAKWKVEAARPAKIPSELAKLSPWIPMKKSVCGLMSYRTGCRSFIDALSTTTLFLWCLVVGVSKRKCQDGASTRPTKMSDPLSCAKAGTIKYKVVIWNRQVPFHCLFLHFFVFVS